jgi:hypothetical protein
MRRLILVILTLVLPSLGLAAMAGAASAATRIDDPKAFIAGIYDRLAKDQEDVDARADFEPPSDIWTPALARDWAEEEKARNGELGRLDFFFWVNGQDWKLSGIEVADRTVWRRPDRRVVTVSYRNFDQENLLEFYFQKVGGRWLIDDVQSIDVVEGEEGSAWTLSLILKYAREEE